MLPVQEKKSKVDAVIQQLALQACQNTIIGSTLDRGVSGGEVTPHQPFSFPLSLLTLQQLSHALYMSDDWAADARYLSCQAAEL